MSPASVLGGHRTVRLDAHAQLELFRDRVDKICDFADVAADFVDHALLSFVFLEGYIHRAAIPLAQLKGFFLLVVHFLQLKSKSFALELQFFNRPPLLLELAFLPLLNRLQLSHLMI